MTPQASAVMDMAANLVAGAGVGAWAVLAFQRRRDARQHRQRSAGLVFARAALASETLFKVDSFSDVNFRLGCLDALREYEREEMRKLLEDQTAVITVMRDLINELKKERAEANE